MFLEEKKTLIMVFWSFCIGFVVILEVAQGCYYNYHILDIKKHVDVCGERASVWAALTLFWRCVRGHPITKH